MIKIETTGNMTSLEVNGTGEELANEATLLLLDLYNKSPKLVTTIMNKTKLAIREDKADQIDKASIKFDPDIGLTGLKKQKS